MRNANTSTSHTETRARKGNITDTDHYRVWMMPERSLLWWYNPSPKIILSGFTLNCMDCKKIFAATDLLRWFHHCVKSRSAARTAIPPFLKGIGYTLSFLKLLQDDMEAHMSFEDACKLILCCRVAYTRPVLLECLAFSPLQFCAAHLLMMAKMTSLMEFFRASVRVANFFALQQKQEKPVCFTRCKRLGE